MRMRRWRWCARNPGAARRRVDEHGALITAAPDGHGRDLNLFLVNAGFAPDSLSLETHDLEQVFLDLTNSSNGAAR